MKCNGLRYFSIDRQAWHSARLGLSPEAKGLFDDIIDQLLEAGGMLPADEVALARSIDCHLRTFRRIWRGLKDPGLVDAGPLQAAWSRLKQTT